MAVMVFKNIVINNNDIQMPQYMAEFLSGFKDNHKKINE